LKYQTNPGKHLKSFPDFYCLLKSIYQIKASQAHSRQVSYLMHRILVGYSNKNNSVTLSGHSRQVKTKYQGVRKDYLWLCKKFGELFSELHIDRQTNKNKCVTLSGFRFR
jgi:hypothetical protein